MDPITIFATVSTLWAGVQKAVQFGREAQDILGQLSQWAQAVDDLDQAIHKEKKKPKLFQKLKLGNATAEAFDEYTARIQLREYEAEIRHMFLYGSLQHLGMDGLREFYEIRRKIREKSIRERQEQQYRRKELVEHVMTGGMIVLILGAGGFALWVMISLLIGG